MPADAHRRLVHGLQQSIEQKGYRSTTITDVVAVAKASRRTFYRVFRTKDDVLLALMADLNDGLIDDIRASINPHSSWTEQVRTSIDVLFAHIERRPAVFLCSIRELPSLGEAAAHLIREGADAFAALIHDLTDNDEFRRAGLAPASRLQAMMVQGALNELIAEILESSDDLRTHLDLAVDSVAALLSVPVLPRSGALPHRRRVSVQPQPAERPQR